jgi:threonine dehydrogenase-like Zn-dependent dehydrogenase
MKVAIFKGKGHIEAGSQPDPVIQEQTDAIVRVCCIQAFVWF